MKQKNILTFVLTLAALLALAVGISQAQSPSQAADGPSAPGAAQTITPGAIPIQGRLTDDSGNPLADGNYGVTFRLYESETGGIPICSDGRTVTVKDGLFSSYMDNCYDDLHGQKVWLSIEVASDGEMSPRQPIYAVPYALSLRPGAVISYSNSGQILTVRNYGSGYGIYAYSANNNGVYASSGADNRAAISGYNSSTGEGLNGTSVAGVGVFGGSLASVGVEASSGVSVALKATGTGIIQSSAKSYLWISGNNLVKANTSDTTTFSRDLYGGFKVYGGSDWANPKVVVLPVTIPGPLYGQDVTVTGLDVYYTNSADLTGISATSVRRQNGVGAGDTILSDGTDLTCVAGNQCEKHWDLTQNNTINKDQGILYIAFELMFASGSDYVQIGGVRLTLEHD